MVTVAAMVRPVMTMGQNTAAKMEMGHFVIMMKPAVMEIVATMRQNVAMMEIV
jgi:hypothetical protein